ncbi:MMPL family transporter, partial [Kineococcus glutinatus]|uniref:MMPL family transporter n=1 Tax=Kineococcus glutinatus TaxID=1070872 RepID=UPI0031E58756
RHGGAPPPRGQALTRFSADHRWWVLLAWALLVAAAVVPLSRGTTTTGEIDELVGDSRAAAVALEGADFGEPRTETVVVTAPGALDPAAVAALQAEVERTYAATPHVTGVERGALSADGRTWVVALVMDTPPEEDGAEDVAASLERTADLARAHPGWQVGQVGPASIDREVGEQLDAEFRRAELLSIPLTLVVLLLAFGSLVSAVVPVVLGLVAVVVALGLTALVSRVQPVADTAASLTLLIGLAVGVDYALFVLRRARAARAEGASVRDSVLLAARTSGRAVVVSGATVVVSMTGMLVAGGLYTSLALGGVLVVAVAVLASATLLPAVLVVLGDRVEAVRLPRLRRRGTPRSAETAPGRFSWSRLAAASAARPAVALVAGGAAVVALAVPALGMRTALPGADALPDHFDTVAAVQRLTAAFPDSGATVDVVVRAEPGDAA